MRWLTLYPRFVLLSAAALGALLVAPAGASVVAAAPSRQAFGVALAGHSPAGAGAIQRLDRVETTWYYDYSPRLDDAPAGYQKVAMVRGGENNRAEPSFIAEQARKHPGHTWLIFNEPDLVGQDAVSDAFLAKRGESRFQYYARLTHSYATTIKAADPSATLVGPNLFNNAGKGLEWLHSLRAAYRLEYGQDLPFDILGVHLYAFDPEWKTLPQINLSASARFLAETIDFASRLPNQPRVWVTEVGSLWIYNDLTCSLVGNVQQCRGTQVDWPKLASFTEQMVRMISAAGVERWFFFSTNPAPDPWAAVPNATYLSDDRNQLTPVGQAWVNATPAPAEPNWAAKMLNRI